eukprot:CAMPEP_0174856646 /NCGR_PEP_ID=MMETSP1114-20130205/36147_1 /TAXON_ID=312471 /ORGANISM="Neobodo designis, Strain CCAP 1951/1" /LENGTH=1129 /DNA_ID=CAMNT_0016091451 /DNA_START=43 /DNA_END=3432 /DNA_ORIENTATION=-
MSAALVRVAALCTVAAAMATATGIPSGPSNVFNSLILQPDVWAVEPSPALRGQVPLYLLATALPPQQYANGSGVSVVVLPQEGTVVSAFVARRNVDGTVEKPPLPALSLSEGTRYTTINRTFSAPQYLMGIIPQTPLSFIAMTNWMFTRLEIDVAANTFVNSMYVIMFGNQYSIHSYTPIPTTRHLAVIGNNETANATAGARFAGVFDYTYSYENARILGPLPAFTQKIQKEACHAKACAVFSPRTNELVVFNVPARASSGNFSSVSLALPSGFNATVTESSDAIVVATSLGGGRVAISNGRRVAIATMSVSASGVVSAAITGARTLEGNVTALRFLGTTGDAIAIATDPAPSTTAAPSSIHTFKVSTFGNGATAVATALSNNGSSIAGLLLYNLDIDHAVVVAQQVPQVGAGGTIASAVGYTVPSNCDGGAVSACVGAATWSNSQLTTYRANNNWVCAPTALPVDVDTQGLTSSNGNVVACPNYNAAQGTTQVTYYAVATGDVVVNVQYAGLTQSTPVLLGRRSSTDQLVSVAPVYSDRPFVQAIDMTKAPVTSGPAIPPTMEQTASYTDPVTGATFYTYSSTLESRGAIRLHDGRLVDVPGIALNANIQMRVINVDSFVVVGTQGNVQSEVVARAVLVVDRRTANITLSRIVARGVTAFDLFSQSPYVLAVTFGATNSTAELIHVSDPNDVTTHSIPDWWTNVGQSFTITVADESPTRALITTATAAALLNLKSKRFVSAPFTLPAFGTGISAGVITSSSNDTIAICAGTFMAKSRHGVQVGQNVVAECHYPLAVTRGDVYTLTSREAAVLGLYDYFVARADFAVGQAAMIPLPGRNFTSSMNVVDGAGKLSLQATGEEQIAVVALGLEPGFQSAASQNKPRRAAAVKEVRSQKRQQQHASTVGVGPAGQLSPYVAGVDLIAGTALWVAPNDGTIGSSTGGINYQGTPLRVRGAENLLFTTYYLPANTNQALMAVDIFTGDVRLRVPLGSIAEAITLVGPLADETAPRISLSYSNFTAALTSTPLRTAIPPTGFRPANGTVFPVTPAPVPTTSSTAAPSGPPLPGPPGDEGGLSTGAKVGIAIGCVLVGLGLVVAIAAVIIRSRGARRADGGAYQEVGGGDGGRVLV